MPKKILGELRPFFSGTWVAMYVINKIRISFFWSLWNWDKSKRDTLKYSDRLDGCRIIIVNAVHNWRGSIPCQRIVKWHSSKLTIINATYYFITLPVILGTTFCFKLKASCEVSKFLDLENISTPYQCRYLDDAANNCSVYSTY